jgi:hypothetical protein
LNIITRDSIEPEQTFLGSRKTEKLEQIINIPENLKGVHKCRLVYGKIIRRIVFEEYSYQTRSATLKLVPVEGVRYRLCLQILQTATKLEDTQRKHSGADEIIIVKNGYGYRCHLMQTFVFIDGDKMVYT